MNRRRLHNKLFRLLNLNPFDKEDRKKLDNEAIIQEAKQNPQHLGTTYRFSDGYCGRPLHQAIRLGASYRAVLALYTKYAIKKTKRKGETALHFAVCPHHNTSLDVVKFLCSKQQQQHQNKGEEKKFILEKRGYLRQTPLHYASKFHASPEVVSLLLEYCPCASREKDLLGATPLYKACSRKTITSDVKKVASLLLQSCPDSIRQKCDVLGKTPLHVACSNDLPSGALLKLILFLLEKWPQATTEKDCNGDVPYYDYKQQQELSSSSVASSVSIVISKVLYYVSKLCDGDNDEMENNSSDIKERMKFFMKIKWKYGIFLILDSHPAVAAQCIDVVDGVLPYFLSIVGQRCKLNTMWHVISNKQNILANI